MDTMITIYNTAVTGAASEILGKEWHLVKIGGLKHTFYFFLFFPWEKIPCNNMGKNPVGILKIPTGKKISHGIFKIPMGCLSLSSYFKPKTKYFLEQYI